MQSTILRLELLVASVLPAAAVLTVGVVGIKQMTSIDFHFFLMFVIVCAIFVFCGEILVLLLFQRLIKEQFSELITTCRDYLAGNQERRATVYKDNALNVLATTLNMLLDSIVPAKYEKTRPPGSDGSQAPSYLANQLQNLISEIAPVTKGDLRVTIDVPQGEVGIIADICQALIEELGDLVKWTRYSSEQVIEATATLLQGTIELAQTVETQMLRLSETTEAVEKLVTFIQRLSSALQVSKEMTQDIRQYLQEQTEYLAQAGTAPSQKSSKLAAFSQQSQKFVERLNVDIERQTRLIEEVSHSSQLHTSQGEAMVTEFYTLVQRIHQSSSGILQTAEEINSLAKLAGQWQNAVDVFQLPEEGLHNLTWAGVGS